MGNEVETARLTHSVKKTFLKSFTLGDEQLKNHYCREEGQALYEKMLRQQGSSAFAFRKKELVRNLNHAGIPCSLQDGTDTLKACVEKLPFSADMDRHLFDILHMIYETALSPAETIEFLVSNLGEKSYQKDSVRLAILKQFLKNTNYHTAPIVALICNENPELSNNKCPEEIAEAASERLFDLLNTRLSKDEKKKYSLLRLCDDLATGRFKSNGSTRTELYMFAFAFDMTVFVDPEKDVFDPKRDIEKNLFQDYYANSMLRFVSDDYRSHSSDYEAEPSGEGINYKNFAEVIYLYYLTRKDLPVRTRISSAEKKIDECVRYVSEGKADREQETIRRLATENKYTYLYKDLYLTMVCDLSEEELVPFICCNYAVAEAASSKARITVEEETNTAKFYYYQVVNQKSSMDLSPEEEQGVDEYLPDDPDFKDCIHHMMELLYEPLSCSKEVITRTDILRAYYRNSLNDPKLEGISLYDLYTNMRARCDRMLMNSRYQPVMDTCLFDMFVLINLYRNLNVI